jgi:hypothetical protein
MKDTKVIQLFGNAPPVTTFIVETEEDALQKFFDALKERRAIFEHITEETQMDFVLFINATETCQYRQIVSEIIADERNQDPVSNELFLTRLVEDLVFDGVSPPGTSMAVFVDPWNTYMEDVRTVLRGE